MERLQAIARGEEAEPEKTTGTSGRRKRDGVVYTPDYIARFIVAETLGTHLREIFEDTLRNHAKKGADITDYENIPWRKKSAELKAWQAYRDRLKTVNLLSKVAPFSRPIMPPLRDGRTVGEELPPERTRKTGRTKG